ncbi:MAG: hypothetical protein RI885_2029 [Actinomycetota bacterium]
MTAKQPAHPAAGDHYKVSLFGGPLDGKSGTVVSEGGLNPVVEFEVGLVRLRYSATGKGSHAGGRSAWSYEFTSSEDVEE